MQPAIAAFLSIDDRPKLTSVADFAGIANLPAHFGVKGGVVGDNRNPILDANHLEDSSLGPQSVVPNKLSERSRLNV